MDYTLININNNEDSALIIMVNNNNRFCIILKEILFKVIIPISFCILGIFLVWVMINTGKLFLLFPIFLNIFLGFTYCITCDYLERKNG